MRSLGEGESKHYTPAGPARHHPKPPQSNSKQHSNLPVILSIENHCTNKDDANGKMQDKMGQYFKEIFGDLLLLQEVRPEKETGELQDRLPPPYALRNKIIVKYKKNRENWRRNLTSLSDVWDYRNSEVGSQLPSEMSRASITDGASEWTVDSTIEKKLIN